MTSSNEWEEKAREVWERLSSTASDNFSARAWAAARADDIESLSIAFAECAEKRDLFWLQAVSKVSNESEKSCEMIEILISQGRATREEWLRNKGINEGCARIIAELERKP
jgi:hypothetical protein